MKQSRFALDIAAFADKAKANVDTVVKKVAIDMLTRVVYRTPVGNPTLWKLADEFGKMPTTVGQALQKVGNSVSALIGEIDQSIGATSGLAKVLSEAATALDLFRQRGAPEGSQARINAYMIERDQPRQPIGGQL